MLDPTYAGAILDSAARQITDPNWPNEPGEREMVAWSPDEKRSLINRATAITDLIVTLMIRVGSRLQRPVTASAEERS